MCQPKPRPAQSTESISAFSRRNFLSSSALMGAGLIMGSLPDRAHATSSEPTAKSAQSRQGSQTMPTRKLGSFFGRRGYRA